MIITTERIELSRTAITTYIVKKMVSSSNLSIEEALSKFIATNTYDLLKSDTSRLWAESPEYVLDMLDSEINNTVENWLSI